MISNAVIEALRGFVPSENIHIQEPMKAHTTFRVGGPADCLVELENTEQLQKVQHYLAQIEIPYVVLGNGSNVLVSDEGYPGIVLQIGERMNRIIVDGSCIIAQAGALLSQVARIAMEQGLTGLEFASGIPGSVGGAVVMNAGAYGGEMKNVLHSVTVYADGNVQTLSVDALNLSYRHSIFMEHPDWIVLSATFKLTHGDREQILAQMGDLNARRREKQPLQYPSSGSFFKRPEGHFAGALIEQSNLKGYTVGGAQVSQLHAGFIINIGNATADDIYQLMKHVQKTVYETFSVELYPEVRLIGEFEK